jgi:MFS family permease
VKSVLLPYIDVLAPPERRNIALAGMIARLPAAILGFGALLLFEKTTESFGLAGLVSGVIVAAGALVGPALGNLADRLGQRRLLRWFGALHLASVLAMVLAAWLEGALVVLVVLAALAGATVTPIGSFTRARWAHLFGERPELKVAFAIEAMADEIVWIIGPALAAFIATLIDPAAGLVASALLGCLGSLLLAAQRSTDTPRRDLQPVRHRFNPFRSLRLSAILVAGFAVGVSFGIDNVSAVAIAQRDGVPHLAGVILGIYSIGSILGGFVLGALPDRLSPYALFIAVSLALAIGFAPLMLAPNTFWVMAIGFVAGATVTPYTVGANRAVESLVHRSVVTEALAWANTVILAGMAVGGPLGGAIVDAAGPRTGYLAVSLVCMLPIVIALLGLSGRRRVKEVTPPTSR